eukprot:Hpha_TRINITY_DN15521_c1_g1::TRINITY_DN15521_c1_g1_i1::g.105129::m.105129
MDSFQQMDHGHALVGGPLPPVGGPPPGAEEDKEAPRFVQFTDSEGVLRTIPLHFPMAESDTIVRVCDPYNEKVYEIPLQYLEKTAGRDTYLFNRTGRRAQVCMKFQQNRCNMRDKCQQIHAELRLISSLRQIYVHHKKSYVSEITCYEIPLGASGPAGGEPITFRYSDVEPTDGKERYRMVPEDQRNFLLCPNFVNTGECPNGRRCQAIHVPRHRYLKAKGFKEAKPPGPQPPVLLVQHQRQQPSSQPVTLRQYVTHSPQPQYQTATLVAVSPPQPQPQVMLRPVSLGGNQGGSGGGVAVSSSGLPSGVMGFNGEHVVQHVVQHSVAGPSVQYHTVGHAPQTVQYQQGSYPGGPGQGGGGGGGGHPTTTMELHSLPGPSGDGFGGPSVQHVVQDQYVIVEGGGDLGGQLIQIPQGHELILCVAP